ncbi:Shikimate dehydrogenase [Sulfuracidifex tepidarius]|uniref:Shikimate dehydrogenase n=2 Tax=Sulfuracidifex tepidarius TaxID=1294262 RepID=A0A510DVN3_9CREN|nr:chorismate mutase [Sulfuracidifex tepidarius]BBG24247.1 Shikimate dehydrogenase [Sulfuracidifex tepidarius]
MTDISSLRSEIDKVDEQILSLLSLRFKLVKEVGKLKRKDGKPLTDKSREEEVVEKWVARSRSLGIPESFIRSILPLFFSYSKMLELNPDEKRRVVIIGYGGMSRSLTSLLSLVGHEVVITGRNLSKASSLASEFRAVTMKMNEAIKWGEIIIITIPPDPIESGFIDETFPMMKEKTVMDITSSKARVFTYLERKSIEHSFRFVSTHPLFGPFLFPVGEKIAIMRSRTSGDIDDLVSFWSKAGLSPVLTDPETHEKAMSIVQVLVHFYMMGMDESIREASSIMGINPNLFETTNFREISKSLERVRSLSSVILEIQSNNPYAEEIREISINALKKVHEELLSDKKMNR